MSQLLLLSLLLAGAPVEGDTPARAEELARKAEAAEIAFDLDTARKARQEALELLTRLHGPDHWQTISERLARDRVEKLAGLTADQRRRFSEVHKLIAEINNLDDRGQYGAAIIGQRKLLAGYQELFGPDYFEIAIIRHNLAILLRKQGDLPAARWQHQQSLALSEKWYGSEHPATADRWSALGLVYKDQHAFPEAQRLLQEALPLLTRTLGPDHDKTLAAMNNLALVYQGQFRYSAALALLEQCLDRAERHFGEHAKTAHYLTNLGALRCDMGDYREARRCHERSLEIYRKVRGPMHPNTGTSLNNLGVVLLDLGDYPAALRCQEEALAIARKTLGNEHPHTAATLQSLGTLLRNQGDLLGARVRHEESLAIRRKVLPPGHPSIASSLYHLGIVHKHLGNLPEARQLYEEALAIREKLHGRVSLPAANVLGSLAIVLRLQGDHPAARRLQEEVLASYRQLLGPEHVQVGETLSRLGFLLQSQGKYAEARPLHEEALAICRKTLSSDHPGVAECLRQLAWALAGQGDWTAARRHLEQSLDIAEKCLELAAAGQSERQQLAMLGTLRVNLDAYLSLPSTGPEEATAAYRHVLGWKGSVFARQDRQRLLRLGSAADPGAASLLAELNEVSGHLAALAFRPIALGQRPDWQRQLAELTRRKESLERELAARSGNLRREQEAHTRTPEQIQAALPEGVVLLDFLEYTHDTPTPPGQSGFRIERRLTVFVLRRGSPVVRLDLCAQTPLGDAVRRWNRQAASGRGADLEDAGAELRRLVWEPLRPHLEGAHAVLVSPDGWLNYLPLGALPGSRPNTYLLEELAVAVVPFARQLPELLDHSGRKDGPAALLRVGDVAFGSPREQRTAAFPPLPGTVRELERVGVAFRAKHPAGRSDELRGAAATTTAFREQAPRHDYLHVATHGFFDPRAFRSALQRLVHEPDSAFAYADRQWDGDAVSGWHPGLLSGLALAGASEATPDDKGILTATELAGFDLDGTQLVVLSACESGLGIRPTGGEGLLGLQRAFQVAGARTVVGSLWRVDDEATQALMGRFYDNLWRRDLTPLEALRQAQLAVLNGEGEAGGGTRGLGSPQPAPDGGGKPRVHPRLWAAWILSGDPGELAAPTVMASMPPEETAAPERSGWLLYGLVGLAALGAVVGIVFWQRSTRLRLAR